MPDWYLFSLAALLLLGSQRFLYKVAAERNCRSPFTTTVFMGTVTVLSGAVFMASGEPVGNLRVLVFLALINSVAFALATLAQMEALRRLPAAITFPFTRLSILVVVGFSIFYFGERPSPFQWFGILLGLAVVVLLAREAGATTPDREKPWSGFMLLAVCVLGGAVASISSKFAAVSGSKVGFMALSYLLATVFSLAIDRRWGGGEPRTNAGTAIWIGVLMGLLNFFGFYAFLAALESGPLSVIALITGMHFVIAIALSVVFFRERVTLRRVCGIGLTLLAVVCLQL